MNKNLKLFVWVAAVLLTAACASRTLQLDDAEIMQAYPSIKELNRLLGNAKNNGTDYLAPEGYTEARELYRKAYDQASAKKPAAEQLAKQGQDTIKRAMEHAKVSKGILHEVLEARSKAIVAEALILFPDDFNKLENRLQKASTLLEHNQVEKAKDMRAELIQDYAALELVALKQSIGKGAREAIARARSEKANDYAPKTFKLAEEELALTIQVLDAGRTQVDKASDHARQSVFYANKAIQITEILKDFGRRDFTDEDRLLWYQKQLETINKPFNVPLGLDQPNETVIAGLQSRIGETLQVKTQREESLLDANENIAILQERMQMMDSKHKQADASMRKQIEQVKQENYEAEQRYRKIQSMFSEDEAQVFRQDNNVLLETHAFNFKVGGSEIDSDNYSLLEKIMEAIRVFDNPDIVIMGHTDSTGSDALNLQLSLKRATTVTDFLKKIGKIPAQKISTRGYGESRPVASNETREGRQRNRRIEVLIINK
jgi:outer membrane protein OmpA-like peptidoglycan-associated protein